MDAVLSTKLTKGGQTTLPVAIRRHLGIEDEGRVYWITDGDRAYVSATPDIPLPIRSASEFWDRISEAEEQIKRNETLDARATLASIRDEHGL